MIKLKTSAGNGTVSRRLTKIDFGESRRNARSAMNAMRKVRLRRKLRQARQARSTTMRIDIRYPGIDLNKSRHAAQNAMDEMRKNRLKHGRIKVSRSERLEGTWDKAVS